MTTIMQQIFKSQSYDENDCYKCLTCQYVTVCPHKYCSNCGEKIAVIRRGLMPKKNAKERIYVGKIEEPTNYYVLWDWLGKGEFSVAYQFYRYYRNKGIWDKELSLAQKISEEMKKLRESAANWEMFKVMYLNTEELAKYRVAGEKITPIRLLVLV